MASEKFHWPLVSSFLSEQFGGKCFCKSDGPMCTTSVEMLKLSKKYSGKESETNV